MEAPDWGKRFRSQTRKFFAQCACLVSTLEYSDNMAASSHLAGPFANNCFTPGQSAAHSLSTTTVRFPNFNFYFRIIPYRPNHPDAKPLLLSTTRIDRLHYILGECKDIMLSYLRCIKSHRGTNDPECRGLSKSYLSCRMDRYVPSSTLSRGRHRWTAIQTCRSAFFPSAAHIIPSSNSSSICGVAHPSSRSCDSPYIMSIWLTIIIALEI